MWATFRFFLKPFKQNIDNVEMALARYHYLKARDWLANVRNMDCLTGITISLEQMIH